MVVETLLELTLAIDILSKEPPQSPLCAHSSNIHIPSKSQFLPLVAPTPYRPSVLSLSSLVDSAFVAQSRAMS